MSESFSEIGSWVWTLEDNRVRWSAGLFRILGLDPIQSDASWDVLDKLVHPDDLAQGGGYHRPAAETGPQERHFRIVRPGGEVRWLRMVSGAHIGGVKVPDRLVGIVIDTTMLRRQAHCQQRFEGLVETIKEQQDLFVWQTEADGSMGDPVDWWRMTGHIVKGSGPWAHLDSVHPDDRPKVHDAWESAAHSGSFRADIRVLVDGRHVPARSRASPIRDPSGRITGWIGFSVLDAPQSWHESVTPLPADSQISAPLIRAARGLLDWTAMQLAENSGLSFSTIRRIEMPGPRSVRGESFIAVRTAFEKHGVQFIQLPDGRAGVACAT